MANRMTRTKAAPVRDSSARVVWHEHESRRMIEVQFPHNQIITSEVIPRKEAVDLCRHIIACLREFEEE